MVIICKKFRWMGELNLKQNTKISVSIIVMEPTVLTDFLIWKVAVLGYCLVIA